jgi:hypothetical protein
MDSPFIGIYVGKQYLKQSANQPATIASAASMVPGIRYSLGASGDV